MAGALCSPSCSLCSPRAGLWSGASERNGLMKWGHQEQRPGRGKIGKIASWLFLSVRLLRNMPAALCLARSSEAAGIHLSSSILKYSQVRRAFLSSSVRGSCFLSLGSVIHVSRKMQPALLCVLLLCPLPCMKKQNTDGFGSRCGLLF